MGHCQGIILFQARKRETVPTLMLEPRAISLYRTLLIFCATVAFI